MTVNRGLDGPLFFCPDVLAMNNHSLINKILNALTFGLLNRIAQLERSNETTNTRIVFINDKLTGLDKSIEVVRIKADSIDLDISDEQVSEITDSVSDSWQLRKRVEDLVGDLVSDAVRDEIRERGLVVKGDLPDMDDYFSDNDTFSDRVIEIVREFGEWVDRTDCRDIISEELDEKNYATKSDVKEEVSTAIETHEVVHHTEKEDDESQAAPVLEGGDALNDTMKPVVLSGKMKTIDVPQQALPEIPPYMVAMTKDEYEYLLVFRAYRAMQKAKRNGDDPDDADTMQEVLGEFDGIDSREGLVSDFIQMTAELAFALGLWMEELSSGRENDGDSKQALCDSIMGFAYDEVGHAVLLQHDNLKRARLHATIISSRSDEENS